MSAYVLIVEVIRAEYPTGRGTPADPNRRVVQYSEPSGKILLVEDPARPDVHIARDWIEEIADLLNCEPAEAVAAVRKLTERVS